MAFDARTRTTALACALMLAACGDKAAAPATGAAAPAAADASVAAAAASQASATSATSAASAASSAPSASGEALTLRHRVQAGQPEWLFTVRADARQPGDAVLKVRAIEIQASPGGEAAQHIDGLDTETPWTAEAPGLEFIDLNFDGYADLRLIERLPAGPNVPRLNWLYDPASRRFVSSPALNAITALRVDAARRELLSDWTDGPTREGVDAYAWRDGQLLPLRREARSYTAPGRYTVAHLRWVSGSWQAESGASAKRKGP